jgi:autotransporter-associated beta strand protein
MKQTTPILGFMSKSMTCARGQASKLFLFVVFVLLVQLAVAPWAQANNVTWDASGTNAAAPTDGAGTWSTNNSNWSNGATDNVWTNEGDNAIFGSGGAGGTVSVAGTVVVHNLTLNTNYTITANTLTLTNGSVITVGSNTTANLNSMLAGTGGFTKQGAGTLVLNGSVNNTYTGDTIINNGLVQPGTTAGRSYIAGNLVVNPNGTFVATSGNPGQGVFGGATAVLNGGTVTNVTGETFGAGLAVLANNCQILNAGGTASATYYVTNTDARSGVVFLTRHGFGITNILFKSTAGTVVIGTRPNSSGSEGYLVTLNAGTLVFDKGYANNAANRLKSNVPLTFAGGMLVFSNWLSSIAPSTENPGVGTIFNPGTSSFYSTNAGASGGSMTMGPITRNTGGTFNFVPQAGPGSIGSTTANVNGIVGGWNTYNLTDWTTGTTAWTNLAAAFYQADVNPADWGAASNVTLNASTSPDVPNATTINTLRLTAAATVTLDGTLTLSSGGLLVTGSGATTITGSGTLLGASGADLIVHQNASASLTISSTLADNGAATSLTKDGPGKLIITGTDNMTGTNYLNGGVVEVSSLAELAGGPLNMNGGTLHYTGSDAASSRAVTTRGLGPTFDIFSATVTQTGAITGSGDAIGDLGGITKIGAGTLVLTASNNFNGETVVSNGVLAINGTNNCNKAVWDAGKVTVYGGTLGGTGMISGSVTVQSGGTISPGNGIGTLTLATNLTLQNGSTNLFEVTNSPGTGDLLIVQGNLTVSNGTIAINVSGTTLQPGTYTLMQYSGTLAGSFNPIVTLAGGTINGSMTIDTSTAGQVNLVLIPQVAITSQPQGAIVSSNNPVTFNVSATGNAPISYQWYFSGTNVNNPPVPIPGATSSSYFIASADGTNNGFYSVVVTNNYNSVTSSFALLIVGNVPPEINGPFDQTVIQGNNATFSGTVVIANPAPTFQWQTNGVNVGGATTTSLTLNNVQYALNGTTVSLVATNIAGMVTNNATLTVIVTPVIAPQPTNITVNVGAAVNFVSGATGVPTPGLQWYKNGTGMPGQTSGTLTIASAQGSDNGTYTLVATNAAGSITSSSARLTVISTALAQTTLSPANNATGVCYDTPLYITFNDTVSVVNSGKIHIYNATNSVTAVDIIDLSSNTVIVSTLTTGVFLTNNIQAHSPFQGDSTAFNYFPVITTGSTAAIYPHSGVLTSNQTYYVTMDNGVVADSAGAYFVGISNTNAWRFTTKLAGPVNPTNLVVAADGSGDFATVQGAVDSIPAANTNNTLINIRNGNYVEIVNISGKNNVTFRGQNRTNTVVGYGNNANIATGGSTASRMAFKVNANNIAIENMTVVNTTPQGGSQAEALMINTGAARFIFNNAEVNSLQDTILANVNSAQGYFYNSTVRGNFDYIWGGGNLFITNCLIYTVPNIYTTNNYNLTASRTDFGATNSTDRWLNPAASYTADGIDYVNCKLQADPAVTTITLEGNNGTANGLVSFINCWIDTNHYVAPSPANTNIYVLWEYNNSNIDGTLPVGLGLVTLTNNDPRLLAAQSATNWLYGWQPALAPNIIGQPANQSASFGQSASFNVSATGIPDPGYQWYQNGLLIPGATGVSYNIASAVRTNGGSYSVVVSNGSGSVTSVVATLTYNDTAPVANPSTYVRPVGFPLNIVIAGNLATYWSDVDGDPLALTGPISSTNGASVNYDSTYVHYTNANNVADEVDYTIGDGFGGTAPGAINVIIGPPPTNTIASTVLNGNGSVTLSFAGVPGYTYQLDTTTNLLPPAVWTTISTNTADINGLWQVTDLQATNYPDRFYRSAYRP